MDLIVSYLYQILTFGFYDLTHLESLSLNKLLLEFLVLGFLWVVIIKFIKWVVGV